MSFPRYAECRDCGVQWLGSIPAAWKPTPLKYLADFLNGCVFKPGTWSESGTPIIRIENLNGSDNFNFYDGDVDQRNHVAEGDLLFGWSGNRGTSFGPFIWKREGHYFLNQHIFKIADTRCDVGWFYWCLKAVTSHVEDQATGIIGMVHVTKGDLGAIKVPVPSSEEQTAIATFLDRETGKIDALIAEQEKLLTLLAEKRQATISHVVTHGLNPNVPMKDAGVPWLGEVPAHWEVVRIKDVSRLESGHTPSKQVPEYWENCDIPWVSLNDSKQLAVVDYISETAVQINASGLENSSARMLPPGTVVFTRDATIGLAAITTKAMAVSQHLIAWCPSPLIDSVYLLRVFNFLKPHLDSLTFGATIKTIGMGEVKRLVTPLPPPEEQREIVQCISVETKKLDELRHCAQFAADLLKERRSALIAAVVTGKVDVRQAA